MLATAVKTFFGRIRWTKLTPPSGSRDQDALPDERDRELQAIRKGNFPKTEPRGGSGRRRIFRGNRERIVFIIDMTSANGRNT